MSKPSTIAVYPGTFDPLTLGHEDIIRRAGTIFDKLIIAVAFGHHKRPMLSLQQRVELTRRVINPHGDLAIEVLPLGELLVNFVRQHQANIILRGIRAVSDFDYEFQMAGMNRTLMPEVETIFMAPKEKFQFISGTFTREIYRLGGDISKFVSPAVLQYLQQHKIDLLIDN